MELNILFEDKDIIVINKPAGIAVQTARLGQMDLESMVKNYLFKQVSTTSGSAASSKPPYLAVVHRLDQPVAGIIVFAKTQKAAAILSKQLQSLAHKEYEAYVSLSGDLPAKKGELINYLLKDGKNKKALVVPKETPNAQKAILNYEILTCEENILKLRIILSTGRFHQIRAQLSNAGMPIINDVKYNGINISKITGHSLSADIGPGAIALFACKLTFKHPTSGKVLEFKL